MKFVAQSHPTTGALSLGTDFNAARFRDDLKKNKGARYEIKRLTPESRKQRNFYHGAVIPLWALLNALDYHDSNVLEELHHIAKREFNGELVPIDGKLTKIGKSTKGQLNKGYLDRFIDSLEENYAIDRGQVLDPDHYKNWRDTIFSFGGPDCYICYLLEIKRLTRANI